MTRQRIVGIPILPDMENQAQDMDDYKQKYIDAMFRIEQLQRANKDLMGNRKELFMEMLNDIQHAMKINAEGGSGNAILGDVASRLFNLIN